MALAAAGLLGLVAAGTVGAAPDPLGQVTEYGGLSSGADPERIAAGPDGNLWFTEYGTGSVGRITTAGGVTEYTTGRTFGAFAITAGPDGNLWFANADYGDVGTITPAGELTEHVLAGGEIADIAAGPDGNLWFTRPVAGQIATITPAGEVTVVATFADFRASAYSIAAGPDGNMWFTMPSANRVGKVTTAGAVTEYATGISAGAVPYSIALGPDGNLWFTESSGNRIGKITTAGVVTEHAAGISAGSSPHEIAAGPDGNMWFTERTGNRIGRITPAGVVTEFTSGISSGAQPSGIAAGPDGNMWFTEGAGRIGKIGTDASGPVDADGDGVADAIDADGGAGTSPDGAFSDDTGDGSTTSGYVVGAAGLLLSVADAADPAGVRITTTGPGGPAVVSACAGGFSIEIPAGTSLVLTCGSVRVQEVTGGPVTIRLPGGVTSVSVPAGSAATVGTTAGAGFSVAQVIGTVTLTVDGVGRQVGAGETVNGRSWRFVGFSPPVDNGGVVNAAKAGQAIPLKWRILDAAGAPVTTLASARVTTQTLACAGGGPIDEIEELAPGASDLKNHGNGSYQLDWKSPASYAGGCRTLKLDIGDGVSHTALFRFR